MSLPSPKFWQNRQIWIVAGLILTIATIELGWGAIFGNPLDAIRLRLTKQCANCRFEFGNAKFIDADLTGADLRHANISSVDFSGANLQQANLSFARSQPGAAAIFRGANLHRANISDASLTGVNLENAQLDRTNLQRVNLMYAKLIGANLQNANLTGATLVGADLLNTNFQGANLTNARLCFLPTLPNLDRATIDGALITGKDQGFTPQQKQLLKSRGAIVGGPSERCYERS